MSHTSKDRQSGSDFAPAAVERSGAQRLASLDLEAHLADPARKQAFVTPMFDVIAPRYDAFTRAFSFGMDAKWKADALRVVTDRLRRAGPAPQVLDLACGTGDLAIGVARAARAGHPGLRVLGVDASQEMTRLAQARLDGADRDTADLVRVATGDMSALALPDASADAITAGYAVRNAPDPVMAIREAARVLRVGGTYLTLDFYRPAFAPWRLGLLSYLSVAGNVVGWTWHRSPVVYGYIARSIEHFMSWQDFSRALEGNGFRVVTVKRWLAGGVAMHVAERV